MGTDISLSEFFYNIIPGGLFVILLKYFNLFDVSTLLPIDGKPDAVILISLYITTGLLFGFIFQAMTKLARKYCSWDYAAMGCVFEEKHNQESCKEIVSKLEKSLVVNKNKKIDIDKIINEIKGDSKQLSTLFYLMDNYICVNNAGFLRNYYLSRYAFWSNIFFGLLTFFSLLTITFIIASFNYSIFMIYVEQVVVLIFLIALIIFSFIISHIHLKSFYDVILKSFYMKEVYVDKMGNKTRN